MLLALEGGSPWAAGFAGSRAAGKAASAAALGAALLAAASKQRGLLGLGWSTGERAAGDGGGVGSHFNKSIN